jgi:hypothetical protein
MAAVEAHAANDVLYITFNRPGKLNALTAAGLSEVTALVTHPRSHQGPGLHRRRKPLLLRRIAR